MYISILHFDESYELNVLESFISFAIKAIFFTVCPNCFHYLDLDSKAFCMYTVVQRPPDIAPKNTQNESRKLHTEYDQGNVLTYFFIITLSIFSN
jgi:hypothetical protein